MSTFYEEKGISFPFRVSVRGGATMSVANTNSVDKIVESMQQIVLTREGERCMEYDVYSQIDKLIFNIEDDTLRQVCEYMLKDAINRLETRVTVNEVRLARDENTEIIYALVNFTVNKTNNNYNTTLGVMSNG